MSTWFLKKKAVKLLIFVFSFLVLLWSAKSLYHIITTPAPDFSVLWSSTKELINFRNPYAGPSLFTLNAYPPITFLAYLPLAVLPYTFSQGVFTILSFWSVFWIIYVSLKIVFKKQKIDIYEYLVFASLTLTSFPTKFTLGMGQINLIAFAVLLTSYYFYKNKKPGKSGLLLGLAFLLKPTLAFVLLFFAIRKKWKVVFYSCLVPIVSFLLVTIVFGLGPTVYWVKNILPQLTVITSREIYYNQGILGFVSRITQDAVIRVIFTNIFSAIFVLGLIYYSLSKKINENVLFSLFLTVLLLIDGLSWQHHFVWLIFPYIVVYQYLKKDKKVWHWLITLLSYLFVSWNFKNPQIFNTFPQSLVLSNTFYANLLLLLALIKISHQKQQTQLTHTTN